MERSLNGPTGQIVPCLVELEHKEGRGHVSMMSKIHSII